MAATQVKGVNVTKVDSGTSDTTWVGQGLIQSSIKVWSDVYVTAAEEAASTIQLATLPVGAVVHSIQVSWELASAGAATGIIGDAVDPNRYMLAASGDLSAAGAFAGNVSTGQEYEIISTTTDIILTVAAATLNTGASIKFAVYYTN